MKLDQKQMHLVSQLFMAASKAGQTFDLGRFTKDAGYANETMSQLALLAEKKQEEPLHGFVISVMDLLTHVAPLEQPTSPEISPSLATPPIDSASQAQLQYVGKLR